LVHGGGIQNMRDIYSFKNNYQAIETVIEQLSVNKNLNSKEKEFIKDMKIYVIDNNGFMSDPQIQFLSDIWDKY